MQLILQIWNFMAINKTQLDLTKDNLLLKIIGEQL